MVRIISPILVLFLMALSLDLSAQQKFGHLNSGNLLDLMPEVRQADDNLLSFREGITVDFQTRVEKFQKRYQEFAAEVQAGNLAQRDQQIKEQQLTMEQEELVQLEQEIQQKIMLKREQLLAPILQKVDEAIRTVGQEEKYAFIFDTSTGATLFALESDDVTDKVKAKLNLQ